MFLFNSFINTPCQVRGHPLRGKDETDGRGKLTHVIKLTNHVLSSWYLCRLNILGVSNAVLKFLICHHFVNCKGELLCVLNTWPIYKFDVYYWLPSTMYSVNSTAAKMLKSISLVTTQSIFYGSA